MYLLLTNISIFLGGLGVSGEFWLFGHLRSDFVKKKFSGHIGFFFKKTEGIQKPYLRETARNYEKCDLQNVLEQVFFIPTCLRIFIIFFKHPNYCTLLYNHLGMIQQMNFTSGHTLTIEVKFGSRNKIIRRLQNANCGVVKTCSRIPTQHFISSRLFAVVFGCGAWDPGSGI